MSVTGTRLSWYRLGRDTKGRRSFGFASHSKLRMARQLSLAGVIKCAGFRLDGHVLYGEKSASRVNLRGITLCPRRPSLERTYLNRSLVLWTSGRGGAHLLQKLAPLLSWRPQVALLASQRVKALS